MIDIKQLFNKNTKLVYRVYRDRIEKCPNAIEMESDLLQIGMLALWKCCNKFDPSKGVRFSTYAYNSIYRNMKCALVRENKKIAYLVSMNKQVSNEEECPVTYEDVIASPVNVESQVEINDLLNQISSELGKNSDRIIELVRQGYTQVEIAKELNTTRMNVGNILRKFRKKLKNTLFFEE